MVFYNLLLVALYPVLWCVSRFHRRLKENFGLRERAPDFSQARGKLHIWFHAASAGEFEQARAVALELKRLRKDAFCSFSFFSDSAYKAKQRDTVPDLLFALPYDLPWRMRSLVRAMQPHALIIAKYDAWPNQVRAARAAGVPVYLVSATLPQKSRRWRFPLKFLLRPTYTAMTRIFAINAEHAARLRVISPDNVEISGDTRFDAIAARLKAGQSHKKDVDKLRKALRGRRVLLAGSTYAQSEEFIVSFLLTHRKDYAAVIAPHHVGAERISAIITRCSEAGLIVATWSTYRKGRFDVLVVDQLGLLPHLYPLATVAYVGGGFRGSVHSVIEPVIAGVPVITGPEITNSAEALELAELGLLHVMERAEADLFAGAVENLCKTRSEKARRLRRYFGERLGVSRQIVHTVMDDLLRKLKRIQG